MTGLKTVKNLLEKKHRKESGLFIVEGEKNVVELLASDCTIVDLFTTEMFADEALKHAGEYEVRTGKKVYTHIVPLRELERAGSLLSNNTAIAVAKQMEERTLEKALTHATDDIVLVLDDVRDPGNLGTIIRIADWYGLTHLIASPTTVDVYNPKVIAATMGSFTRIRVTYSDLAIVYAHAAAHSIPVLVSDMSGENIHTTKLSKGGLLVMGSESHGVTDMQLPVHAQKITIPRLGQAESLNVSVATGILLDNLKNT